MAKVWGFSIILILKEIMTFKVKKSMVIFEKKIFNKNETESKMENPAQTFREANLELQLI